jgi:hypothetical protein
MWNQGAGSHNPHQADNFNSDKLYQISNEYLMSQKTFGGILNVSTPALPFIGIRCPTAALD